MNRTERAVLLAETDGREPVLTVRSATRVDAGRWWRRAPLWVCVTEREVVVLAAARRRYVKRIELAACGASRYCHATGELVIAADADEDLTFSRLAMTPADALRVLGAIGADADNRTGMAVRETETYRA